MYKEDEKMSIESKKPHIVTELMCMACYNHWIGTYPSDVLLKNIECPKCGSVGAVVKIGQNLEARK